jgi:hypothetical protein
MDKVKKNFWLIFLFLGVNFAIFSTPALAQYQKTTEINSFPMKCLRQNDISGIANTIDYYIPQFYYLNFRNRSANHQLVENPDAPDMEYWIGNSRLYNCVPFANSLKGKVNLQTFEWLYDINTRIYLMYNDLQTIDKIYIFIATATPLEGNSSLLIQADKNNDLVLTLDNLGFIYDPYGDGFPVSGAYKKNVNTSVFIKKNLNNIVYNGEANIGGYFRTCPYDYCNETIANQFFVMIAEGKDNNNNIARRIIKAINPGTNNNYIKFTGNTTLYTFLNYPVGSLNPNDYDNILKFSLYAPSEYQLYKYYLEIFDNNTGKNLYTSNVYTIGNYQKNLNDVILNLYDDYNFDLKNELINLRNQGYTNLVIYLYVKLIDNNNNETPFLSSAATLELIGGISRIETNYRSWYNDVISAFGLSETTPTPIFKKSAEFIDNTFRTFQSFITIDNDKLNNLKTSIINNLNSVIGYINGFTDALGFLKYLFYGLLVFTMVEFVVKFGRLIIPFK